jgi:hypothetical protein
MVCHPIEVIPIKKILINRLLYHPIDLVAPVFQDNPFVENLGERTLPNVGKI